MEYHEAANALFDLRRRHPPRPGTAATAAVLDAVGDPHADLDCVQVAGSNGKGSTVRMLESILDAAGYRVGRYTSPHLDDVRERVRVDGRKIPEWAVCEFVEAIDDHVTAHAAANEPTTFFEATTAMAYWWFARQDVDVAVVEVGIGGRHDATSVVDPVASAVTTITLEHTAVLGDSIANIARDKAHVAPAMHGGEAPLVTAASGEARDEIRAVAGDLLTVGDSAVDDADVAVDYRGHDGVEATVGLTGPDWSVNARSPLLGAHQARNAGVAAALARQFDADEPAIERGLRGAHWPGRFEVVEREPLVVLDGAHNPGACAELAATLNGFDYARLHLVIGALADKDIAGMAAALPTPDRYVACRPARERAADQDVVARAIAGENGVDVETRRAVGDAVGDALATADPDDCVLVTGSLYTVAEARERWMDAFVPQRIDDPDAAAAALRSAHVTGGGVERMTGKAVHRTIRARVHPRQASYLKQELLSLGGECAVSGVDDPEERCDVVLMGTLEQLARLARSLDGQPHDLERIADRIESLIRDGAGAEAAPARGGRRFSRAASADDDLPGGDYPWADGPVAMGILNVTPDSFHDGGRYDAVEDAVHRAEAMIEDGAAIVDVGGESTRPGADPVPVDEEVDRVVPVIERLADADATISVDTRKAAVAEAALDAGADLLNDVSGLDDPAMPHLAAAHDVPIVVMHSLDAPVDPDRDPDYDDVVHDVLDELHECVQVAERAGLDREQIVVDPGIGFGKSAGQSLALLDRLDAFHALGCPIMVGHSHKSLFQGLGYGPDERRDPTVAGTALAVVRGADVVRVHDVAPNVAAIRTATGTLGAGRSGD